MALTIAIVLIAGYQMMKKSEGFDYSNAAASKLCGMQSQMIGAAPFMGGASNQSQAMSNCMASWTPSMNMPMAYISSQF